MHVPQGSMPESPMSPSSPKLHTHLKIRHTQLNFILKIQKQNTPNLNPQTIQKLNELKSESVNKTTYSSTHCQSKCAKHFRQRHFSTLHKTKPNFTTKLSSRANHQSCMTPMSKTQKQQFSKRPQQNHIYLICL